jgi:DNA-binding transcriptional ArsR family regulator
MTAEPTEPAVPPRRTRRPATVQEVKALAHPMRMRILRLCAYEELTNKQLADRLGSDPGTVFYHVRMLVKAGMLEPAAVRTGESGALEKPYRSTGESWWLDGPLEDSPPEVRFSPVQALLEELREGGLDSVERYDRFVLHLSPEDVVELERRVLAVLDEYIATDDERRDQPPFGGIFLLHRPPGRNPPAR